MSLRVAIVSTGAANLASVCAAVRREGGEAVVTENPGEVARAGLVVLPGVGAFGPAMEGLRRRGLDTALRERVERGGALLAICLGMQVLFDQSGESPGVRGLGVVAGRVERFEGVARVPQMGWNAVSWEGAEGGGEHFYFANSFRVACGDGVVEGLRAGGWRVATAEYGGRFVAAMARGGVLACQFHPELSGSAGRALLRAWLERGARAGVGAGTGEGVRC